VEGKLEIIEIFYGAQLLGPGRPDEFVKKIYQNLDPSIFVKGNAYVNLCF
jgi:hypothetical protein